MRVACLLVFVACCACACHEPSPFFTDAGPLVATSSGRVVGKYVKVFDTDVAAFLGIPFAEPPTGERRFRPPEPAKPWRHALLAHEKPPPCMQHVVPGQYSWVPATTPSEDCLYLNVWAPKTVAGKKPLPVLVWIHGGGFTMGSTDMEVYDGRVLAAYGPAVVVSMNYRLGMFGFMSDGTDSAPGNAGLHDQLLAMRWVKKNIGGFGGDPDAVTVFGESAGAMSVSMHLVSPLSKGLFRRAIMQSGSMYNPVMVDTPEAAKLKVAEFAKAANCPQADAVQCFRDMDAADLAKLESSVTGSTIVNFLPRSGDDFLPRAPIDAYESGDLDQGVDVLAGTVSDEGTLFLPIMVPEVFRFDRAPKLTPQQAESVSRTLFRTMPKQALDAVVAFYFQNTTTTVEGDADLAAVVAEAFGDSFFNCPAVFLAEKLAGVHLYWLTHRSSTGDRGWLGAHHFSEVAYVFGGPIVHPDRYNPEDARFSGQLIRMWVNFARDGHPLSDQADGPHIWRKFTSKDPVAMELNPRSTKLIPFPRYEVCDAFWRHMFVPPKQEHVEAF